MKPQGIGAAVLHARYGGREITAAARKTAGERLNERLCAEHGIPADAPDFDKRLANARSAHFGQLALASARARRTVRR